MIRAAVIVAAAALVAPGYATAARFAVGVDRGASVSRVAAHLKAYGPVSRDLSRMRVLVVDGSTVRGVKRIDGVRWVEWLGSRRRHVAFTPSDPLASKQWYLQQDHAFDFWPEVPVGLPEVKVAVVDSGIDLAHPDLASRIALARSFVSPTVADTQGHGTFVAGQIAASVNNAEGIAGIGIPAQLLVAKVVRADGTVSLEAEAERDPVGGRPGSARDQPQPRRPARSEEPVPRHVFAAGGSRGRLRGGERRRGRRGRRQQR